MPDVMHSPHHAFTTKACMHCISALLHWQAASTAQAQQEGHQHEKPCLYSFQCVHLNISADIKLGGQLDEVCESQLHSLPYEWGWHRHHHSIAPNAASVPALLHATNPFSAACCKEHRLGTIPAER